MWHGGGVNTKLVIAVVVALALGLAGYILLSDRGSSGSAKSAARPAIAGKSAGEAARFLSDPSGKAPELTPEEERKIRAALEQAAGAGGAAKKVDAQAAWTKPVVEAETRSCQERAQSFVPPNTPGGAERVCACALPAVQKLHPQGPPNPARRRDILAYGRAMSNAIEDCASMPR
jgi:hypothetical protein